MKMYRIHVSKLRCCEESGAKNSSIKVLVRGNMVDYLGDYHHHQIFKAMKA